MGNEQGEWIMHGLNWDDPACIHTVEEAIAYIKQVGFLPLFKNEIEDFSLEERTNPKVWWCGDRARDPWEWRQVIASRGDILYGKFFDKKAGFITKEWFPYFANARRDGYDFDALYDDEKASIRSKKIMDLFMGDYPEKELFSFELKERAGFGKGGEKNFEGALTQLQMQTYLCVKDFDQKRNKKGEKYGWSVAIYTMPENILGYDQVTSAYNEPVEQSLEKIMAHMKKKYPKITEKQQKKVLGITLNKN